MGLRSAAHRFMPRRLVFPGGSVDRADFSAAAAAEPNFATTTLLERTSTHELARALAIAAARELNEETALSLGTPPNLAALAYLCRAITPPELPIRFHARFFVVAADALVGSLGGSGELEGLRYYTLGDGPPEGAFSITCLVLEELAAWLRLPRSVRLGLHPTACFRNRKRREE